MLGSTYSINNEFRLLNWDLSKKTGIPFENYIYNILSKELKNYYSKGLKLYRTARTRDNGKDIIIETNTDILDLFGIQLFVKNKTKIYIECKSSEHSKIRLNEFIGNLARVKNDQIDYYILVTNTTITPYSYYQFENEAKEKNISFILIDQYVLIKYLKKINELKYNLKELAYKEKIYIEYQSDSFVQETKKGYDIYFLIRNYNNWTEQVSLTISSNRNWFIDSNNIEVLIEKNKSKCIKISVVKDHYDGINDLILNIKRNNKSSIVEIKGVNAEPSFIPPFCGKQNIKLKYNILKDIKNNHYSIKYLFGETGLGKSRIVTEISREILGTDISLVYINCEKNINPIIKLKEELKDYYKNDLMPTSNTLIDIIKSINTDYRKVFIVFDDLHNSDTDFRKELKVFQHESINGIFILAIGRNDFSVDNMEYFTFIKQCESEYENQIYYLLPLNDDESKNLIRSIVKGIPAFALKKIHKLSNNNPLFIVQTIEYFLDINLVKLINRNTVGLNNPEAFNSHLYIPKTMNDIYSQRIDYLLKNDKGIRLLLYLCVLATVDIDYYTVVSELFFYDSLDEVDFLLERNFIKIQNEKLLLAHESLLLFLKDYIKNNQIKKNVSEWIISNLEIFDSLCDLKRGQLYIWNSDFNSAKEELKSSMKKIEEIKNYSSININTDYYYYLDELLLICENNKQKESVIACGVYIALHYHTPYDAIRICNWAKAKSKSIFYDKKFKFYLQEQTAHSMLNAGQLRAGETILNNLLSHYMNNNNFFDKKTLFDLYDKLSSLHIKYNNFDISKNYCDLSARVAIELNDDNLKALSNITYSKLYLYKDFKKAKTYMNDAKRLLNDETSFRINCHNNVTCLIYTFLEEGVATKNIDFLIKDATNLLRVCINNSFANSIVRLYQLLASLYYYKNQDSKNFDVALNLINNGIDVSVKFGISTYIWEFYNLLALISININEDIDDQSKLFNTVLNILSKQNLLYFEDNDFIYPNILALSNIAMFYQKNDLENVFDQKLSKLSMIDTCVCDFDCSKSECSYECKKSLELLNNEWHSIKLNKKGHILFNFKTTTNLVKDNNGYYIIVS